MHEGWGSQQQPTRLLRMSVGLRVFHVSVPACLSRCTCVSTHVSVTACLYVCLCVRLCALPLRHESVSTGACHCRCPSACTCRFLFWHLSLSPCISLWLCRFLSVCVFRDRVARPNIHTQRRGSGFQMVPPQGACICVCRCVPACTHTRREAG